MSGSNYQYQAQQTDAVTRKKRTLVFDNRNGFRKTAETCVTQVGGQALTIEIRYVYSESFSDGALPSMIQVAVNNQPLAEGKAVSYDSDSRTYVMSTRSLSAGSPEKLETFRLNQVE
jgi:hypothetical protein